MANMFQPNGNGENYVNSSQILELNANNVTDCMHALLNNARDRIGNGNGFNPLSHILTAYDVNCLAAVFNNPTPINSDKRKVVEIVMEALQSVPGGLDTPLSRIQINEIAEKCLAALHSRINPNNNVGMNMGMGGMFPNNMGNMAGMNNMGMFNGAGMPNNMYNGAMSNGGMFNNGMFGGAAGMYNNGISPNMNNRNFMFNNRMNGQSFSAMPGMQNNVRYDNNGMNANSGNYNHLPGFSDAQLDMINNFTDNTRNSGVNRQQTSGTYGNFGRTDNFNNFNNFNNAGTVNNAQGRATLRQVVDETLTEYVRDTDINRMPAADTNTRNSVNNTYNTYNEEEEAFPLTGNETFPKKGTAEDKARYEANPQYYRDIASSYEARNILRCLRATLEKGAKISDKKRPYVNGISSLDSGISPTRGENHFLGKHPVPVYYDDDDLRDRPTINDIEVYADEIDDNGNEVRCDADTFFTVEKSMHLDYTKDEKINVNRIRINEDVHSVFPVFNSLGMYYPTCANGVDPFGKQDKYALVASYDQLHYINNCNFNDMKEIIDEIHEIYWDGERGQCVITAEKTLRAIGVLAKADNNASSELQDILLTRFNEAAKIELGRFIPIEGSGALKYGTFTCDNMAELTDVCAGNLSIDWIDTDSEDYTSAVEMCLDYAFGAIWSRGFEAPTGSEVNCKSSKSPYLCPDNTEDRVEILTHKNCAMRFGKRGCISNRKLVSMLNTDDMTEDLEKELNRKLQEVVVLRIEQRVMFNNLNLPNEPTGVGKKFNKIFIDQLRQKNFCAGMYKFTGIVNVIDIINHSEQLFAPMLMGSDWDNNMKLVPSETFAYI